MLSLLDQEEEPAKMSLLLYQTLTPTYSALDIRSKEIASIITWVALKKLEEQLGLSVLMKARHKPLLMIGIL